MPARESLESALKEFDGTILFVSHDRYFIEALADKIFELEDGKINSYACKYTEYNENKRRIRAAEAERKSIQSTPAPTKSAEMPVYKSKEERKNETKRRIRTKELETEIEQLERESESIGNELSSPSVAGNFSLLSEKCNRVEEIKNLLDALYAEYEELL